MLFNSIDFALFLPLVFGLYWSLRRSIKAQNFLLLVASYVFYGWWDWRFLSLIAISSAVDFIVAKRLENTNGSSARKALLVISLAVNLGLLGVFKYYNFFLDNLVSAFTLLGNPISPQGLDIVLPVGISFYTFQTLSYTIDVYRRKMGATKDALAFFAYVSFFPQLVAGPIERAMNLLPQFSVPRVFSEAKASDGMKQILWGLFKKVVIADNCAVYANMIFNDHEAYRGFTLFLGAVFFAFQIYGDFSGYSDIAIGTARLFGFNLMQNFAFPYFSRDIAEFWRRWHISLSTWFRDYVYIPLGGSRGTKGRSLFNIFVIFAVSGFWHGPNWTFILWGLVNAAYFIPLFLTRRNRTHLEVVAQGKWLPSLRETVSVLGTFCLTTLAWVFFRAESAGKAFDYLGSLFGGMLDKANWIGSVNFLMLDVGAALLSFLVLALILEWLSREYQYGLAYVGDKWPKPVRWGTYYLLAMCIFLFGGKEQEFIYFQF